MPVFIGYLHPKFYKYSYSDPLITVVKATEKYRFQGSAILLYFTVHCPADDTP
jgi:hypothetical protein